MGWGGEVDGTRGHAWGRDRGGVEAHVYARSRSGRNGQTTMRCHLIIVIWSLLVNMNSSRSVGADYHDFYSL